MNLKNLEIPRTCAEMIKTYYRYYHGFDMEVVRTSNTSLNTYLAGYIDLLRELSKMPNSPDVIRTAIGVVALHQFGYDDFSVLSTIFDRLLPQLEYEYAKFTSWCVGQLIHHPDEEKSRYVRHLFERCASWTRSKGRRGRPLAAALLLCSLSANAGSNVVIFFPLLQSMIWTLVSHPSKQILLATGEAIAMYTRAIKRYGRGDLDEYLKFFLLLCMRLLSFGDPIREYGSLILLEKLINSCPDYFAAKLLPVYSDIATIVSDAPPLVRGQAYAVTAALSQADPKQFADICAPELFDRTSDVILEFPMITVNSLCLMIKTIPGFMKSNLESLLAFVDELLCEPECALALLTCLVHSFGDDVLPRVAGVIEQLLSSPIVMEYRTFFVSLAQTPGGFSEDLKLKFNARLCNELANKPRIDAIKMLAEIDGSVLVDQESLLSLLRPLSRSPDPDVREVVAKAIFNVVMSEGPSAQENGFDELLQMALIDRIQAVRCSILIKVRDNASPVLAMPKFMKLIQVFVNDDAASVRKIAYQILANVCEYNPISVASMAHRALVNSLFVIKQDKGIRQCARVSRTIPYLVKISPTVIKAYSNTFINILLETLANHRHDLQFTNFLERQAHTTFLTNMIDTVALLAPIDPDGISLHAYEFVSSLCRCLNIHEDRLLVLSVLNMLYVLLTPPASTLKMRAQVPLVLSACAEFLALTHSRKARIASLKIIGAIGVLEVHQKVKIKSCKAPVNTDENLTRQFFHPSRDVDVELDESLLLDSNSVNQYFVNICGSSLLAVLKDDSLKDYYIEAVQSLTHVLERPRMHTLGLFDEFVMQLLNIMRESCDSDVRVYLHLYAELVTKSGNNTTPFLGPSINFVCERFTLELAPELLELILAFLKTLQGAFSPYIAETVCVLVKCLDSAKTVSKNISKSCLEAFSILGLYASDMLHMIIPQVCDVVECQQSLSSVQVFAFETLISLASVIDIFPYIGAITRAIHVAIFDRESAQVTAASIDLLNVLLQTQGILVLDTLTPLLNMIRESGKETRALKDNVHAVATSKSPVRFRPIGHKAALQHVPNETNRQFGFTEEVVVSKAITPSFGVGRHMEEWLRSFVLSCITYSPSDPIRACASIATTYPTIARKLFNAAFLSCWREMSDTAKSQITQAFHELLMAEENYDAVARELLDLIAFMDKIDQVLEIPANDLVHASIRYGRVSFALYLQTKIVKENPENLSEISNLIEIYVSLGDWDNGIGVWKKSKMISSVLNKAEILAKLKMWDQVMVTYRERFNKTKSIDAFHGYTTSLSAMAMWPQVLGLIDRFKQLRRHDKAIIAEDFAEAALHMKDWDALDAILEGSPDDSLRCNVISALSAIHREDWKAVDHCIEKGFSLLASRPLTFWSDSHQIHRDTMLACQELVEVSEMKHWVLNQYRKEVEEVWNERLKTAPRDFDVWFGILANRGAATAFCDENLIKFFQMKSVTLGTKVHRNAFNSLFPCFDLLDAPDLHKVCYVIAQWSIGEKEKALETMEQLTEEVGGSLQTQCRLFAANWIVELDDSLAGLMSSFHHLSRIIVSVSAECESQPRSRLSRVRSSTGNLVLPSQIFRELLSDCVNVDVLRKWSEVNTALIEHDPESLSRYVTNAIDALTQCARRDPSFPDVVQLLNLFFDYAHRPEVFNSTAHQSIKTLPPQLLLQASPQILVQLSHQTPQVAAFVHDTVFTLLMEHYHELTFALLVMEMSRNKRRAKEAKKILDEFKQANPSVYQEVKLIRESLLRVAVTWYETTLQRILDAYSDYQEKKYDKVKASLQSIVSLVDGPGKSTCKMHEQFIKKYGKRIAELKQILDIFTPSNQNALKQVATWCNIMQDVLTDELQRIQMIQLSAISEELCTKDNFHLAVPGTYKPGHKMIRISYFVGKFSVYNSKQRPKDVVIKGDDGRFYQYLLKGHEDLRLDERIMQFFRVINSLVVKETCFVGNVIQTICVIPLTMLHGLVQWVPGTETLRNVVDQYRLLHNRDCGQEYALAETYGTPFFNKLQGFAKMQILNKIFLEVPDTDIANFFWLIAKNAETWLKHVTNFSISTAMTSIVGYVIGLGDRHPSNLLLDRFTGRVIHIDFGDCFERAALRKFLPEVVPFRLTRMMVRAMGAAGVDGIYRTTFINMSNLLRENHRILIMVLAVFVQEPLIDPELAEQADENSIPRAVSGNLADINDLPEDTRGIAGREMRNRVKQKISGTDFEDGVQLSVEEQADRLIEMAHNVYLLSKMYDGWGPFF